MLTAERHRHILRLLSERRRLTVVEMASRLGISTATARRDASDLADGTVVWQPSVKVPPALIAGSAGAGDAFAAGCLLVLHED